MLTTQKALQLLNVPYAEPQPHSPELDRHARKCAICHHPDRDEIDADYLHWRSPRDITREYQLQHHSTIYRHAEATGLKTRRRDNVHVILDSILENSDGINPSAASVITAVRLSAQMTGQWREPERTYIIIHKGPDGESTTTRTGRRPNLTQEIANATLSDATASAENLIANAEIRK